jgi:hypothetical protein
MYSEKRLGLARGGRLASSGVLPLGYVRRRIDVMPCGSNDIVDVIACGSGRGPAVQRVFGYLQTPAARLDGHKTVRFGLFGLNRGYQNRLNVSPLREGIGEEAEAQHRFTPRG